MSKFGHRVQSVAQPTLRIKLISFIIGMVIGAGLVMVGMSLG